MSATIPDPQASAATSAPPPTTIARTMPSPPTSPTTTPTGNLHYNASGKRMDTEPTTTPPPSQNEDMAKALLMLSTILGRKNPEKDNLTAHFEEQAAEKDAGARRVGTKSSRGTRKEHGKSCAIAMAKQVITNC